jgi:polysaccharide biosynthesis protein PslH
MRLLYVTNGFPWPLTSGHLRHFFFIRELAAAGHDITLMSVVGADHRPGDRDALAPYTARLFTFPSVDGSSHKVAKAARRITGEPATRAMAAALEKLSSAVRFDACLFSGRRTTAVLQALPPGVPVVADLCDATSARMRTMLRTGRVLRAPVTLIDLAQVSRVEHKLIGTAAHLLFASARDRDALTPAGHPAHARTTVVPNGVDTGFWARRAPVLGDAVVFTGVMGYPPNEDAALRLLGDVLPIVRRHEPDVPFLIVGRNPTPRLRHLGRCLPGVTVTGFVDDVRPWLERAAVFAATLRQGAGIQNKVLEAMAMDVPVVASPLAADGLRVAGAAPPPVTVAATPDDIAAAVINRIRAARAGSPPAGDGRAYVMANFSWRHSGALIDETIQRVAGIGCDAR